ncbi:MAG: Ppx/GppA family phosphatase [Nannocystaceae bacterium]
MRAVIDIGSNSLLLLLGTRDADGVVQVAEDLSTVTRLSRGVDVRKTFSPEAVQNSLAALTVYREKIDAIGATLSAVVATEGVRMATDAETFLAQVEAVMGAPVRTLSGEEEAELSFRSVSMECPEQALHVIDVGGASTELAYGIGADVQQRCSLQIGSVRLTERYLTGDPPTVDELDRLKAAIGDEMQTVSFPSSDVLVGLAGTVTTAAALLLGIDAYDRDAVDGSLFSADEVRGLASALAREPVAARQRRPCLPPGRADVIVAGLHILLGAMDRIGATRLMCRDRGHRFALL